MRRVQQSLFNKSFQWNARKRIGWLLSLGIISGAAAAQTAGPLTSVEIIGNNQTLLQHLEAMRGQLSANGIEFALYNLDAPQLLNARLSQGLPREFKAAKQLVLQRLNQPGMKAQFEQAFKALNLSLQYSLDRYPAVVFNHGEAVIYGETDLKQAVQRYLHWRDGVQ